MRVLYALSQRNVRMGTNKETMHRVRGVCALKHPRCDVSAIEC